MKRHFRILSSLPQHRSFLLRDNLDEILTLIVGVDGPTASRARIGAVGNQNRSRP